MLMTDAKLDDLMKKTDASSILIAVVPESRYAEKIRDISFNASKRRRKICYVTLNKPYKTMAELFGKQIDSGKFVFIDGVTNDISQKKSGVAFVSSPGEITELEIEITRAMDSGADTLIIDSLSTLLIYGNATDVVKFMHHLATNLRMKNKMGIFMVLEKDIDNGAIKDISMFVDNMIGA